MFEQCIQCNSTKESKQCLEIEYDFFGTKQYICKSCFKKQTKHLQLNENGQVIAKGVL